MNVISLDSIFGLGEMKSQPAPEASGCTTSSCGSSDGPSDMAPEVWEKVKNHPCYSEEAHHYYARMHVAVAPACNIQCNYCNRKYDCANESRPGVVSEKLTAEQAVRKVIFPRSGGHLNKLGMVRAEVRDGEQSTGIHG
jgi:nitrogen fixation protein NifB